MNQVGEIVTEPITAWRVYSIGDTGALRPLTMTNLYRSGELSMIPLPDSLGLTYTVGDSYTAIYHGVPVAVYPNWPIDKIDEKISRGGFYARRSRSDAMWYLLTHIAPKKVPAFAVGPVLLEGTVVVGKLGYQAEQMTVLPPELVLVQEDLDHMVPFTHYINNVPISNRLSHWWDVDWKGLRVISWTEWKKEKEAWILERPSESSRLYLPPLRSQLPPQNPFLHRAVR